MHAPQHDDKPSPVALSLELRVPALEPWGSEGEDERGARVVEVGEVRAVGFVEVVVDFQQGGVGGEDVGREDRVDGGRGALERVGGLAGAEVGQRMIQDPNVPDQGQVFEVQEREQERHVAPG